jgi:hypothetical protein
MEVTVRRSTVLRTSLVLVMVLAAAGYRAHEVRDVLRRSSIGLIHTGRSGDRRATVGLARRRTAGGDGVNASFTRSE